MVCLCEFVWCVCVSISVNGVNMLICIFSCMFAVSKVYLLRRRTSLGAGRSFLPSQQRVHISNNNRHIKLSKLRTPCRYVVGYIHRMVIGWPESVLVHVEVRFLDISSLKYFEKVDELIFVNKYQKLSKFAISITFPVHDQRREGEVE